MQSTTANKEDDDALLDVIEARVHEGLVRIDVSFEKVIRAEGKPWQWQITYKSHSMYDKSDGQPRSSMVMSGGLTLREALTKALVTDTAQRIER